MTGQVEPVANSATVSPKRSGWLPFGEDGVWLEEADWVRNLDHLRDRALGLRALAALRNVFTPAWSREQNMDAPGGLHPAALDAHIRPGRFRLLEVGAMISEISKPKKLRGRLLVPSEYFGACAEFQTGLMLKSTGADVEWEPVKGRSGPDWLARWSGGALGVEVKRPNVSVKSRDVERAQDEFFFEFTRACGTLPVREGVSVSLHSSYIELPRTILGAIDTEQVKALAREVADVVGRHLSTSGTFSAGRIGHFVVTRGVESEPRVQCEMLGSLFSRDSEHDSAKLFATIQEGTKQLEAVSEPGLLVLDADDDWEIVYLMRDVAKALQTERWARHLAGIAVVTRANGSRAGRVYVDTIVRVVAGVQVDALRPTLLSGMTACSRGHFHVDPMLPPTEPCEFKWC